MSTATLAAPPTAVDPDVSRGADAAWRRAPWWVRGLVLVVAGVLAVQLVSSVAGSRTVPQAATSPTATGAAGTAAMVALLRTVTTVSIAVAPLTGSSVPTGATLLVIDPIRWAASDRAVARSVVDDGGHVVFVGAAPPAPGPTLPAHVLVTRTDEPTGQVVATAPGRLTYGVRRLVTGQGGLSVTGPVRVLVRGSHGVFCAAVGGVVWLGSSAPLRNAALGRLDDAALALNLVTPWRRGVVIDAAAMTPQATATGLRALPSWWVAALAVAFLAAVAWLASAGRRFGPLEARTRTFAPPRTGHAVAVGALLESVGSRRVGEASAPVADAAHRALLRALAIGDVDDPGVAEAAAARGIPGWVVRAATAAPVTKDEAVAAGRALAWLTTEGSSR